MKKYTSISDFLTDLDSKEREQIELLRAIILGSVPVTEHIKWNAPSYVFNDEDRITFNIYGSAIKIIIHMGATRKEDKKGKPVLTDELGLVEWSSNIRGTITFKDLDDIKIKQKDFENLLQRWLKII